MTEDPKEELKDQLNPGLVVVSELPPAEILILPLEERPIFPGLVLPLFFSGHEQLEAIRFTMETKDKYIGVSLAKNKDNPQELCDIGIVVKIFKVLPIDENTVQIIAQGMNRFKKLETLTNDAVEKWKVEYHFESEDKPDEELKAYTMAVISSAREILKLNPIYQEQLKMLFSQMRFEKPGFIMDLIASTLSVDSVKLQTVLEAFDLYERGKTLLLFMKEEIEILQLQEKIKTQIDEKLSKQQKDFFLREELKIIKKELGIEKDDKTSEIEKIEKRLEELKLTEEAKNVVQTELAKIKIMEPNSPEFNVVRNYLDLITSLPWGIYSEEVHDITRAREILNKDHYGLEDVKSRILEFISTIIKRGKLTGSNILLVGPPGVGKTSIGKSIAHSLGRNFYRFSVGGMRDEAEIKGHRRTYIGAMPGKLIESVKRTKTANPVIMLDEIDKIGKSYQGDPASALLEVLDPEQNENFMDHYLDVRFDLSKVLFIATANQLDTIPFPLLDRMEIIRLSGYILEEKKEIAKKYLIPRQMEQHGLKPKEVKIEDNAINIIIDKYAREAGVRNLENQIKKILRHVTLKQAEGSKDKYIINKKNVEEFLGKPVFTEEELYNKGIPGTVLGLAYTAMGGATLYVEANGVKGNPGFKQTGQLGEVMKESSEIAYSFIRSLLKRNEDKTYFDEYFIHLHVPAGATPKDGPSAGVTMALALYSLALGKSIKPDIAMTGELSLTGKVLPIGGVREKTIAARRVGVVELIFPKDNRRDFEELPEYIRKGIKVHYANYFSDVVEFAFKQKKKDKKGKKK